AARDEGELAQAQRELKNLGRSRWGAEDWRWRKDVARLEMVAAGDSAGIALDLVEIPPNGAVIELRLDGADLGAFAVPAVSLGTPLRIPVAVRRGLHVLELSSSYGGQVLPGAA